MNPKRTLTEDQVRTIRRRRRIPAIQLAGEYGVSPRTIRDILHERTWRGV